MTDNLSKASAPVGFDGLHTSEQKATQLTVSNHPNESLILKGGGTYISEGIAQTLEKPHTVQVRRDSISIRVFGVMVAASLAASMA